MNSSYNKTLKFIRDFRIISVVLTVFVMYWGWDTYQFVNLHFKDMESYVIIFYTSIIGLSGWVVKNWMSTTHNDKSRED